MVTPQILSWMPKTIAGISYSALFPAIVLGFLAAVIALRLYQEKNHTLIDPATRRRMRNSRPKE